MYSRAWKSCHKAIMKTIMVENCRKTLLVTLKVYAYHYWYSVLCWVD